jgi:hypothetical protein
MRGFENNVSAISTPAIPTIISISYSFSAKGTARGGQVTVAAATLRDILSTKA